MVRLTKKYTLPILNPRSIQESGRKPMYISPDKSRKNNTCQPNNENKDQTKNCKCIRKCTEHQRGGRARKRMCSHGWWKYAFAYTVARFFRGVPGLAFLRSFMLAYDWIIFPKCWEYLRYFAMVYVESFLFGTCSILKKKAISSWGIQPKNLDRIEDMPEDFIAT